LNDSDAAHVLLQRDPFALKRELSEILAFDDPACPRCELSQEGERGRTEFIVFVDRAHGRSIAHLPDRWVEPLACGDVVEKRMEQSEPVLPSRP